MHFLASLCPRNHIEHFLFGCLCDCLSHLTLVEEDNRERKDTSGNKIKGGKGSVKRKNKDTRAKIHPKHKHMDGR